MNDAVTNELFDGLNVTAIFPAASNIVDKIRQNQGHCNVD